MYSLKKPSKEEIANVNRYYWEKNISLSNLLAKNKLTKFEANIIKELILIARSKKMIADTGTQEVGPHIICEDNGQTKNSLVQVAALAKKMDEDQMITSLAKVMQLTMSPNAELFQLIQN